MVRRPIVIAPPPVVVDEYPVYAAPRIFRHLPCMRTPVRFGATDGAINVTFAAVGKSKICRGAGEATPVRRRPLQKVMSALKKRTCAMQLGMSALGGRCRAFREIYFGCPC